MAHDVFISYSSLDKAIADAVCAKLENRKIRCWIAPRDVPAGQPYAAALVNAINASKVMVLILSGTANESVHVLREVGEAVDNGIPVIPLRIEDVEPTAEMRYYIKSLHWLDAMSPPIERHLDKLAASVQALLGVEEEPQPAPLKPETVAQVPKRPPLPKWAVAAIVVAAVILISGVGAWALSKSKSETVAANPTQDDNATGNRSTSGLEPSETDAPTHPPPTEEIMGASHEATFTPEGESSWTPLEFMIPDPQLWEATEAGRYTAVNQSSVDAFAWSAKTFEGDLTISLDIESPVSQSEGCVIIYGRGGNYSYGSLIFCLESEYYQLEKHSRYHEGENFLAYAPSDISFKDMVYSVTIEIKGDTASMFVNGNKVLSTILDLNEIERSGRIGLHKLWAGPEVTFSNIHVNTPSEEEQVAIPTEEDVWDCEKDAGGNIDFYPIDSPFSTSAVQIDGKISSFEEWSNAACVDFRLHYQTVTNPNFQRARWWVQNNETDIFFLVRIPSDQVVKAVMFSYYWPEYTGTWPQSDRIYVRFSGEIFDYCFWDEMNWYKDEEMDPPGNIDLEAAVSEDGDFIWFEIKRPLNSGDGYDWALEPGLTIGYNPYDSLHISVLLEEGSFIRYLQLTLGEP